MRSEARCFEFAGWGKYPIVGVGPMPKVFLMQHTLRHSPLGASGQEDSPSLNVVIAYEDFETAKQAKRTSDVLAENLRCECHFTNQMWKFGVLAHPKLREMAITDAAHADIIIVACRGGAELPAEVRSWLNQWMVSERRAMALVALFDCGAGDARNIRNYLAGLAEHTNTRFFAQPETSPGGEPLEEETSPESAQPQRENELSNPTLSTTAGAVQRDFGFSHWGINE